MIMNATTRPLLVQDFLIPVDTRELSAMATSLTVSPGLQGTATTELLRGPGVCLTGAFLISLMVSVLLAFPEYTDLGGGFPGLA